MNDEPIFNLARRLKRRWSGKPLEGLTQAEVDEIKAVLQAAQDAPQATPSPTAGEPDIKPQGPLTLQAALELIGHEAIVQEAYRDSVDVWTWGIGVTNASGHIVYPRYMDNPQTIEKCIEVFLWLLREKYIPSVLQAFKGHRLAEHEFAAALSFHYNTGAIGRADWVRHWKAGDTGGAHRSFMNWNKPREIKARRTRERDLFFDARWSADGKTIVYPVRKPSYAPDWSRAKKVDVAPIVAGLML